jgi:hypothetical protein
MVFSQAAARNPSRKTSTISSGSLGAISRSRTYSLNRGRNHRGDVVVHDVARQPQRKQQVYPVVAAGQ